MVRSIYTSLFLLIIYSSTAYSQSRIIEGTLRNGTLADPYKIPSSYDEKWEDFHYLGDEFNSKPNDDYMNFLILKPANYDESGSILYPMVVMLHGAGESGRAWDGRFSYSVTDPRFDNNTAQLIHGGSQHEIAIRNTSPSDYYHFPGFALFPQVHYNGAWSSITNSKYALNIIDSLIQKFPIDPNRIYLHGLSNGGKGTWNLLKERPDLFAAGLPMSAAGGADISELDTLKHIPIWISQGELDSNPTPGASEGTINALATLDVITEDISPTTNQQILPDPDPNRYKNRYTLYPGIGHGVWNLTYNRYDFFAWMLQYSKLSIRVFGGRTEFCPGESFNVTLGITANFDAYEWSKDGVALPSSDINEITVSEYGNYRVRFSRGGTWTEWSEPVHIKQIDASFAPTVTASSSTNIPSLDGNNQVILQVTNQFAGYQWYRNGVVISGATAQSYTASQAGSYTVDVLLEGGCSSAASDPVVVNVNASNNNLLAPDSIVVSAVSDSEIQINWNDNNTDENGYEVYAATIPGGPYSFLTITDADVTSYSHTGLSPGTTYYYRLRSVNNSGPSSYSVEAFAATSSDVEPPTAPVDLNAIDVTDSSLKLVWTEATDNIGVDYYDIYQNSIKIGSTNNFEYVVSGLSSNTLYSFTIKAVDLAGNESPFSNQITVNTFSLTANGVNYEFYTGSWDVLPDFDALIPAITGTTNNFNIGVRPSGTNDNFAFVFTSFIDITVAGQYTFYTSSDDGSKLYIGETEVVDNDGLHGTQERSGVIDLEVGKFPITVTFFERGGGESLAVSYAGPGLTKTAIPDNVLFRLEQLGSTNPPNSPTALSAIADGANYQINLAWTDNATDETGFEIYRATTSGGPYAIIGNVGANITAFADTDLQPALEYFYQVRAISNGGESEFSNEDSAIAPAAPGNIDNAPTGLSASYNNNTVSLNWSDNASNETGYIVQRALGNTSYFNSIANLSAGTSSYQDNEVASNQVYYYKVLAYNISDTLASNTARVVSGEFADIQINFSNNPVSITGWNNKVSNTIGNSLILSDLYGIETALKLELNTNFSHNTSATTPGVNDSPIYPDAVYPNGFQITQGLIGSLKLYPVNFNKDYQIDLLGNDYASVTRYSIGNESIDLSVNRNYSNIAQFNNVSANEFGEIIIEVSGVESIGYLTTIVFREQPITIDNPSSPTNLTASVPIEYPQQVNLAWTSTEQFESGIEVYRSTDNINFNLITTLQPDVTSYSDSDGTVANTTYYYKIRNVNIDLVSDYSNTASATTYAHPANTYYAIEGSDITILSNWTENPDGTGANPVSFEAEGNTYVLPDNANYSITSDLRINGNNTVSLVGNNIQFNVDPAVDTVEFYKMELVTNSQLLANNPNQYTLKVNTGGLTIHENSILHLGDNSLFVVGPINANNESGCIASTNGIITFKQSATFNSNLYFMEGQDSLQSLAIDIASDGSVQLNRELHLRNNLTLTQGELITSDSLVLVSDESGTANLGQFGDGAILTGMIEMQRYWARSSGGLYYLGTPVKQQTIGDWLDDFHIQGISESFPGAFTNIRYYDEPTSTFLQFNSSSDIINPGQGVFAFLYNSQFTKGYVRFDNIGEPVIGNGADATYQNGELFEFPGLSYTSAESDPGWLLVANPFASTIDWGLVDWSNPSHVENVGAAAYVWNGATSSYTEWTPMLSSSLLIAPGQGFFIKANGANPVLRISDVIKSTESATFFREKSPDNKLKVTLRGENKKDVAYLVEFPEASFAFDPMYDALLLDQGFAVSTSLPVDDSKKYAINTIPQLKGKHNINLNYEVSKAGTYNFNFENLFSKDPNLKITLYDKLLDSLLQLESSTQYAFAVNSDQLKNDTRFELQWIRNYEINISGKIIDRFGKSLPNVSIKVSPDQDQLFSANADGEYSLNLLNNQKYSVIPEYNVSERINVADLVMTFWHLSGNRLLDDPYRVIASDVDGSASINWNDFNLMLKSLFTRKNNLFYKNWTFVDAGQSFSNANDPFPFQSERYVLPNETDHSSMDFIGVAIGKVAKQSSHPKVRMIEKPLAIELITQEVITNHEITIPVMAKRADNIAGFQFAISWNPDHLEFIEIKYPLSDLNVDYEFINDGKLSLAWISPEIEGIRINESLKLLNLEFLVKDSDNNKISIGLDDQIIEPLAINNHFEFINIVGNEAIIPVIGDFANMFRLYPNTPNPATHTTHLRFILPEDGVVAYQLVDTQGRVILDQSASFQKGLNNLELELNNLKQGVYFCRFSYLGEVKINKIMVK